MKVIRHNGQTIEMEKEPNGGTPVYSVARGATPRLPLQAQPGGNKVRTAMALVREKEREYVKLGEIQGPGGLDMGDLPPPPNVDSDDDLNPVKPPTSMADVAEMFVDYSKNLYSKSNLNPNEVMPIAVGLSFYEKYGVQIGMEWIFKLLALKQSEKGSHHRVSQIMKIFEHLVGTTKTSEEKKIQL